MRSTDRHAIASRVGASYLALWAATGAAAAAGALTGLQVAHASAPHDALEASAATALELLSHNALVALWPLGLVALGWPAIPVARVAGDALIAVQLLAHGLVVGDAVAQHPQLWRFLPHLPAEWLALAIPAAAWLHARRSGPLGARRLGELALLTAAALMVAAGLETWVVPL